MNKEPESLISRLNLETAQIPWRDLQTFFAAGMVLSVSEDLDLLHVAEQLAADNAPVFQEWLSSGKVGKVEDSQAMEWFDRDTLLWAVVIKPWVLVQQRKQEN